MEQLCTIDPASIRDPGQEWEDLLRLFPRTVEAKILSSDDQRRRANNPKKRV